MTPFIRAQHGIPHSCAPASPLLLQEGTWEDHLEAWGWGRLVWAWVWGHQEGLMASQEGQGRWA
jgi:hypothetical protein